MYLFLSNPRLLICRLNKENTATPAKNPTLNNYKKYVNKNVLVISWSGF